MARGVWLACLVAGLAGCSGEVINLGSSQLQAGGTGGGSAPKGTWAVQSEPLLPQELDLLANPTLDAQQTELYYSAQERGSDTLARVEVATRSASRFATGVEIPLGDPKTFDASSPAVSANADELWFSLLGPSGHSEIWLSTRQAGPWSAPVVVSELNSQEGDSAARPPATVNGSTIMPLSSKRHGGIYYQIYFSERRSGVGAWSKPHQTGLGNVNSSEFQSADGFLSDNGLALYFSSTRDGDHADSDLYVARRTSTDADFAEPEPLSDLNDPLPGVRSEERMPWLSPDGAQLYFVSDRNGQYTLYLATKL